MLLSAGGNNTGTLAISGGTANVRGLGFTTSGSGNGTLNLTGGQINIGAYGIADAGGHGTRNKNLGGGTVGALADWSSSEAMNLSGTNGNVTFNTADAVTAAARTITFSGVLSGAGGLIKANTVGTLSLTGTNTFSGTTTINGGTLAVGGAGGFDATRTKIGSSVVVNSGATLRTDAVHQFGWTGTLTNLTVNSGGTFNQNSTDQYLGTLTLNGNATLSSATGYIGLTGGAVNYTGTGIQQTIVANTLRLQNTAGGAVTSTFTVNGTNTAGDLVVSGAITDGGGLIKEGGGIMVLSGTNTYTGATAVNGGTLLIGTTGSLANTAVTVGGAGTSNTPTLAGGGTIGGATIIASAGGGAAGTHSVGVAGVSNGVGTQTFSSTLEYQSGSIFSWDLAGTLSGTGDNKGSYDKVVTTGATTGSDAIFNVVLGTGSFADPFWNSDHNWTDIFTTGATSATLDTIFTTVNSSANAATQGAFTFTGGTNTLNWSAVPEPTSALAGLLLAAGLLRRRRVA